jgi:hypothetical protein
MARLDVFPYLACCAWSCRGRTDAQAAAHVHACIDRYDVDIGSGLLHQGRATLEGLRSTGVMIEGIADWDKATSSSTDAPARRPS